jgi:CheY-like chemotaxis protein
VPPPVLGVMPVHQVEYLPFIADRIAEGLSAADAHRLLSQRLAASPGPGGGEIDGTTKLLILLAERDLHAADLTEYFLRTEGYQVVGVFDADEALGQPTDAKADLAVIDLLISGGRGLDLCRKLSVDGTPVLAVSTLDMQDQALEAGAGAFLLKPLDPLQLVSTIRDLLRESAYLRGRP